MISLFSLHFNLGECNGDFNSLVYLFTFISSSHDKRKGKGQSVPHACEDGILFLKIQAA